MGIFRKTPEQKEEKRLKQLRRVEIQLEDAEYHLETWGFGNTPSQTYAEKENIERLKQKVRDLGGDPD